MKELVKCSTPGVTAAIVSRHSGTARLALRLHGVGEEQSCATCTAGLWHSSKRRCAHAASDAWQQAHQGATHRCHAAQPASMPYSRIVAGLRRRIPPQLDHIVQHACGAEASEGAALRLPAANKKLQHPMQCPITFCPCLPSPRLTNFCAAEEHELPRRVGCHLVRNALLKCRQQPRHTVVPRLELRVKRGGGLGAGMRDIQSARLDLRVGGWRERGQGQVASHAADTSALPTHDLRRMPTTRVQLCTTCKLSSRLSCEAAIPPPGTAAARRSAGPALPASSTAAAAPRLPPPAPPLQVRRCCFPAGSKG